MSSIPNPHPEDAPPIARMSLAAALSARPSVTDRKLGASEAARSRGTMFAIALLVINVLLVIAILLLIPLKEVRPVLVQRMTDGSVITSSAKTDKFETNDNDKKYFLALVTRSIWTIDRLTTERDIKQARRYFIRDKADRQLADWITTQTPIARLRKDPGLTRKVEIHGVSIFETGAIVDYTTTETATGGDTAPVVERMLATYHFSVLPPTAADEDLILTNPAGLYITNMEFKRKL
jgi:type IV secretory pathway component VirB8